MLSLDVDERVQDVVDRCCQSLQQYVSVVVMINVFNVDVCIGAVSSWVHMASDVIVWWQLYLTSLGAKTQQRLDHIGNYSGWDVSLPACITYTCEMTVNFCTVTDILPYIRYDIFDDSSHIFMYVYAARQQK